LAVAHEQRPHEPGPLGDRDEVDVVERDVGRAQRVVHDVVDERQVVAGGDLGHHAPVAVVDAL
jgi:hypothetical protein